MIGAREFARKARRLSPPTSAVRAPPIPPRRSTRWRRAIGGRDRCRRLRLCRGAGRQRSVEFGRSPGCGQHLACSTLQPVLDTDDPMGPVNRHQPQGAVPNLARGARPDDRRRWRRYRPTPPSISGLVAAVCAPPIPPPSTAWDRLHPPAVPSTTGPKGCGRTDLSWRGGRPG